MGVCNTLLVGIWLYLASHMYESIIIQVHLATEKLGQSVDECDALLKKHEAYERLLASQEDKVTLLIYWLFMHIV